MFGYNDFLWFCKRKNNKPLAFAKKVVYKQYTKTKKNMKNIMKILAVLMLLFMSGITVTQKNYVIITDSTDSEKMKLVVSLESNKIWHGIGAILKKGTLMFQITTSSEPDGLVATFSEYLQIEDTEIKERWLKKIKKCLAAKGLYLDFGYKTFVFDDLYRLGDDIIRLTQENPHVAQMIKATEEERQRRKEKKSRKTRIKLSASGWWEEKKEEKLRFLSFGDWSKPRRTTQRGFFIIPKSMP